MKQKSRNKSKVENIFQGLDVLTLKVVGYQEDDGVWAAHCLEMDLVGYGKSFKKASENLKELIEMQIDFAIFMEQPTLIYHPAPPRIFQLYELLLANYLQHFTSKKRKSDKNHRIANFPLPSISRKEEPSFVPC